MSEDPSIWIGLALASGAGLSTCIGALTPFFRVAATRLFLCVSIAFAAGVMGYVSFVELLAESMNSFRESDIATAHLSTLWGSLSFFGGILLTTLLDFVVHRFGGHDDHESVDAEDESPVALNGGDLGAASSESVFTKRNRLTALLNPTADISFLAHPIDWIKADWRGIEYPASSTSLSSPSSSDHARLKRAGIMSTAAVALHNLPEGLATFFAYMADPTVGISLAVAIAIHNIPEGICVAMPIYHATGSRLKGFVVGCLSGISEIIGALIGVAMISAMPETDLFYGIMFAAVAGMMVYISFKELLPMAHKYDPSGVYASAALFAGMFVMAVSLALFDM